jgi:hypothetical protein
MTTRAARILVAIAFSTVLFAHNAKAQHFELSVSPTSASIPAGRTTPAYTLVWSLARDDGPTPPLVSDAGRFLGLPGNIPLGRVQTEFRDETGGPIGGAVVNFVERLRIPASVLQRAQSLGVTRIGYVRRFAENNGAGPAWRASSSCWWGVWRGHSRCCASS